MKAYGVKIGCNRTSEEVLDVVGACITEEGQILGYWTSSDDEFLAKDLKNHADKAGCEYEYLRKCPQWLLSQVEKRKNSEAKAPPSE